MKFWNEKQDVLYRLALLLLTTALLVLGTVTFYAKSRQTLVEDRVTALCGEALTNIELNLRQGDALEPEHFYRFHEITRVYPDTNYAVLSQTLLELVGSEDTLSQSDRDALADLILKTNDPGISDQELEPVIYEIEAILAPYLYR